MGCASLRALSDRLPSGQICTAPGFERFLGIEHERQRLVVDRDQLQRFLGDMPVDRRDRGDRLANEPDRVVERVAAMLGDLLHVLVVLLAAGDRSGAPDDLAVLVRR